MANIFILFFGLGEWIESNPGVTVVVVMAVLGAVVGYAELRYSVSILRKEHTQTMSDLYNHTGNQDAHVNQLYIGTLKERIGKLETGVEAFRDEMAEEFKAVRKDVNDGHQKIRDQIDNKFDALAARMGPKR